MINLKIDSFRRILKFYHHFLSASLKISKDIFNKRYQIEDLIPRHHTKELILSS